MFSLKMIVYALFYDLGRKFYFCNCYHSYNTGAGIKICDFVITLRKRQILFVEEAWVSGDDGIASTSPDTAYIIATV